MSWTSLIAWRYFRSSKKDKFVNLATNLSIIASTLAIAFLIISFSIIRGYKETLVAKLAKSSGHIVITDSEPFPYKEVQAVIKNLKHELVAETHGLISSGIVSTPAYIYASSCANLKSRESNSLPIVVSNSLAAQMHYKPTDIINIIVPITAPAPFFILPENISCEIVKVQKFENEELNENGILMNLSDLQNVLGTEGKVHKIKCFSHEFASIGKDYKNLCKALPKKFVLHWEELNEFILKVLKSEQNVFLILLTILTALACLLYIVTIGMFMNSKKSDINILKIFGASNFDIYNIFIRYSMIVSSVNCLIGSCLGIVVANNVNYLVKLIEKIFKISLFADECYLINNIPTSTNLIDISLILGLSMLISFLSSLWISRKMNSLDVF